ncbi:MAG TPA: HNH endonuclease [Candidatus Limnocylindria bacterium]|nr:HNH endonuclease [Candidatus Limnocylindria bacterium]
MKIWVAVTDRDWFRHLSNLAPDEVNFWQPSAERAAVTLEPGAPFLFKLHAKDGGRIVGGGYFAHYTRLPVHLAWDAFGQKNGAATLVQMTTRISRYRKGPIDPESHVVGCFLLAEPFFLDGADAIHVPAGWAQNIVQGRTYDTTTVEGAALWASVERARAGGAHRVVREDPARYGAPAWTVVRLGQGIFRSMVTDAYSRRCAITGERTLPVLEAAHIRSYANDGPHSVDNGLLLRADLHTLFDRGYITVTTDLTVRVSPRIRDEFENGRDYYALDRRRIATPAHQLSAPRPEFLQWHGDVVFRP